jgi:protein MpaA
MKVRAPKDIGTIPRGPEVYGHSVLGRPLEVWRPSGACKLLIHAGIHGEEGETTVALSRALRALDEPSPHCAVVLAVNPDGLVRGTRGNANGVDLNRNFATRDWSPEPVRHRSTLEAPREVELSTGASPGSEPEVAALVNLIEDLNPGTVVALHAPLACIDDAKQGALAAWIAERTGLPLVPDVGYPTPGSFGTWGGEQGVNVVTYEFEMAGIDHHVRHHVPILTELLVGVAPWS